MKRIIFVMSIIAISISTAKAQYSNSSKNIFFSIGVEPSFPVGRFNDAGYNFGIGGSVQAEYKVLTHLGITLNGGFIYYSSKGFTIGNTVIKGRSYELIPVFAGVKYYFSPKIYGHAQAGIGVDTYKNSGSYFGYSPGVGFIVSKNFDVLIKYVGFAEPLFNLSSIGARIAYNF